MDRVLESGRGRVIKQDEHSVGDACCRGGRATGCWMDRVLESGRGRVIEQGKQGAGDA
jgi:hypothetical protein